MCSCGKKEYETSTEEKKGMMGGFPPPVFPPLSLSSVLPAGVGCESEGGSLILEVLIGRESWETSLYPSCIMPWEKTHEDTLRIPTPPPPPTLNNTTQKSIIFCAPAYHLTHFCSHKVLRKSQAQGFSLTGSICSNTDVIMYESNAFNLAGKKIRS